VCKYPIDDFAFIIRVLNAAANNYIFVCTVHVLTLQHFGNR